MCYAAVGDIRASWRHLIFSHFPTSFPHSILHLLIHPPSLSADDFATIFIRRSVKSDNLFPLPRFLHYVFLSFSFNPFYPLSRYHSDYYIQQSYPRYPPFIINTSIINDSITSAFKKAWIIPMLKNPLLRTQNDLHSNHSCFKVGHSTDTAILAITAKFHAIKLLLVLILLKSQNSFVHLHKSWNLWHSIVMLCRMR